MEVVPQALNLLQIGLLIAARDQAQDNSAISKLEMVEELDVAL